MADFDDVVVKPYRLNDMLDKIERAVTEGPKPHPRRAAANGNGVEGEVNEVNEVNGEVNGATNGA